jgi:hypothetical protein
MTMTLVYRSWRPASIKLPDGRFLHRCLVLATSDGLMAFERPGEAAWSSPIVWARTAEPKSNRTHIGVDIETEDGTAVVTPTGGCNCGSAMRGWSPDWAYRVAAWPREPSPAS